MKNSILHHEALLILLKNLPRMGIDFTIATFSFAVGVFIRGDFDLGALASKQTLQDSIFFSLCILIFGFLLGIYRGKYKVGTIDEMLAINTVSFIASLISMSTRIFLNIGNYPRSVPIISALIFVLLALTIRAIYRLYFVSRKISAGGSNNILIYGAGILGQQIANLVSVNPKMNLVGFIDDDPYKSRLVINGNRVVTNFKNLENFLRDNNVNQILLAITNLEKSKIDFVTKICGNYKVSLRAIDSGSQILLGVRNLDDLISLNQNSLLGRDQISIDREAITKLLKGKSILVTGSGGSIGSEIARQCVSYSPREIYLLDRDESALHSLELEIFGTGLMNRESIVLVDIRDRAALDEVFKAIKPQIVFHAAALKHLPILEKYPEEALKTNVEGTRNVLELSEEYSVEIFVNISTDKAADPSSILGISKMKAEQLTRTMSEHSKNSKYISVRFGNVIGSRGSVMHTFKYQIDNDLPITITDPEVTRYFMTVKEAVELVLQSSVVGGNGETLILDMGDPVRIVDVAQFMIKQSGKELPIKFTGLREGEKLHEVLNSKTENLENKYHAKIFHTNIKAHKDE